jgi:hypothetical protein
MHQYTSKDFVFNLVLALTGADLNTIPEPEHTELVHDCLALFIDYISHYIQTNYSVKDAIRVKSAYETGDDILKTFPELIPMYEAAYNDFLKWLKTSLLHAQ